MRVDAFDFELPPERIAQRPSLPRDEARLLHVRAAGLDDRIVRELPELLRPGDLLVLNDTKVIPARLFGRRGEARVEVTLHQPEDGATWRAFARPARRCRTGDRLDFASDLAAEVVAKGEGGEVTLAFGLAGAALLDALHRHGHMPLPPYIKRSAGADAGDAHDYQNPFGLHEGAVAAPTASLHFTPRLLAALEAREVARTTLTLHVGAGTFLPVKADDTADHRMHAERFVVPAQAAEAVDAARAQGGRIVAVGTTVLRALETVAARHGAVVPAEGTTDLFVTPGYPFRVVDLLLTNFHLPRSTLFMLVAAFAGLERMQRAYAHAIEAGYRFFSYGDACLLERAEPC